MLSALFVRDAIFSHVIHVQFMYIAKLATFESQEEVVCMTHLWNPKKEGEKGQGIEMNATGIVALLKALSQQREAWLARRRVKDRVHRASRSAERLACETPSFVGVNTQKSIKSIYGQFH